MCHLLSIPGLGGETFGEIGGETIDETIIDWVFQFFWRSQQVFHVSTGQAVLSEMPPVLLGIP